jgi:hypothetical protein
MDLRNAKSGRTTEVCSGRELLDLVVDCFRDHRVRERHAADVAVA